MRLFCELGWHQADPIAPWNNGYYFSKCRGCGRDLVRAAYGGWRVPKGYRVVWRAAPPEGSAPASLAAEPAAALPSVRTRRFPDIVSIVRRWNLSGHTDAGPVPSEDKLPIQEVLRHASAHPPAAASGTATPGFTVYLDDDWGFEADRPAPRAEHPAEQAAEPAPQPEPQPEPAGAPSAPDPPTEPPVEEAVAAAPTVPVAEEAPPVEAPQEAGLAPSVEHAPSAPEPSEERFPWEVRDEDDEQPERKRPSARAKALSGGAVLVGLTALGLALSVNRTSLPSGTADAPPVAGSASSADPAPMPAAAEETAIVTASIINCRSAPTEAAPVVRKMVSGLSVQVLERQPEWTRVAYRGRQCWLSASYLASEVPMQARGD